MARKSRKAPVLLTLEAFEQASNAGRTLTVSAHDDDVLRAFAGEVIAVSPCGTMCEIDYCGEFVAAPVASCRII